jgi:hypothetical protein
VTSPLPSSFGGAAACLDLHSAIALGHTPFGPLVAGDGRRMSLKSCAGEDSKKVQEIRRRPRQSKTAARGNQSVVSLSFRGLGGRNGSQQIDRLQYSPCLCELLVRRLIFVSDVDLKATRVASVLLAPAID